MTKRNAPAITALIAALSAACSGDRDDPVSPPTPAGEEALPRRAEVDRARPVILATTTSTQDSGLLDVLIPIFEEESGLEVKTVAVGTGQALEMGRRGEADTLLVHAPDAEKEVVAAGHARNRRAVMHNDFVVVGPEEDPAGVRGSSTAAAAFAGIADAGAAWVSRGDDSGTHKKELSLWKAAGIEPAGEWYVATGQGMGATLRIASERRAYALADRGTFVATENLDLEVLVEGDPLLHNPYHVLEVVHANANTVGAARLAAFFVSERAQRMIRDHRRHGLQIFEPDALRPSP